MVSMFRIWAPLYTLIWDLNNIQVTQVDHKDNLGIIKDRRIDTNVYSQ